MGIIQYLAFYWKEIKTHLVEKDNNIGTTHSELYIKLSVHLEQLGVASQNVVNQFSKKSEPEVKKKKGSRREKSLGAGKAKGPFTPRLGSIGKFFRTNSTPATP